MAGVTDVPFRSLCKSFMDQGLADSSQDTVKPNHASGLFVNQMITARAFVEENKKTMKLAEFGEMSHHDLFNFMVLNPYQ